MEFGKNSTILSIVSYHKQTFWGSGVTAPDQNMTEKIKPNDLIWEFFEAMSCGFCPKRLVNLLNVPFWYPSTKGFSSCSNLYEIKYEYETIFTPCEERICSFNIYVDAKEVIFTYKNYKGEGTQKVHKRIDMHL